MLGPEGVPVSRRSEKTPGPTPTPTACFSRTVPALASLWHLHSPVGTSPSPGGDRTEPGTLPVSRRRD